MRFGDFPIISLWATNLSPFSTAKIRFKRNVSRLSFSDQRPDFCECIDVGSDPKIVLAEICSGMNKIRFDIQHGDYGDLVVPVIDGESLIHKLKDFELPFAKEEGSPEIAVAYSGLPITMVRPPSRYYYGKDNRKLNEKTPILICDCLWDGCWDVVVDIELIDKKIIWKNFEQIHRENWNYSELGAFSFDKIQFEKALRELENK